MLCRLEAGNTRGFEISPSIPRRVGFCGMALGMFWARSSRRDRLVVYEGRPIQHKRFAPFDSACRFADDTVLIARPTQNRPRRTARSGSSVSPPSACLAAIPVTGRCRSALRRSSGRPWPRCARCSRTLPGTRPGQVDSPGSGRQRQLLPTPARQAGRGQGACPAAADDRDRLLHGRKEAQ